MRLLWLAFVLSLWLTPLFSKTWRLFLQSKAPSRMRLQFSVAELFTSRSTVWSDYAVQIYVHEASGEFTTHWVPLSQLSSVEVAGERTRLGRMFSSMLKSQKMRAAWLRFAEGACRQLRGPSENGEIKEVRIYQIFWRSDLPEQRWPNGGWRAPEKSDLATLNNKVVATILMNRGKAVQVIFPEEELRKSGVETASGIQKPANRPHPSKPNPSPSMPATPADQPAQPTARPVIPKRSSLLPPPPPPPPVR